MRRSWAALAIGIALLAVVVGLGRLLPDRGVARPAPFGGPPEALPRESREPAEDPAAPRRFQPLDWVALTTETPVEPESDAGPPAEPELPRDYPPGPVLRGLHPNGEPFYEGTQVRRADGTWVRDGAWRAWHENGAPYERGDYADGSESGRWEWWYPDGTRMASGVFDQSGRQGPWTFWYPNGNRMMVGHYTDGEGAGPWIYWHENGVKAAEGEMVAGAISGWWNVWDEEGALVAARCGLYEEGERVD